jgi:TrmH family RNA methyltransferase
MVVKSQLKYIRSLHQKKYRIQHGHFFVEGLKAVEELLDSSIVASEVYCSDESLLDVLGVHTQLISERELQTMSALKTPNKVLGVFKISAAKAIEYKDWVLALDGVRDPGNLGTIIRLCDWFGIEHLVCSKDTADCYNPKVLQATMGSIARVNVVYTDLEEVLKQKPTTIFGSFMDAQEVYSTDLPQSGVLLMGNEGQGIRTALLKYIDTQIGIPKFGAKGAESLNVATATAILLSEIRRK